MRMVRLSAIAALAGITCLLGPQAYSNDPEPSAALTRLEQLRTAQDGVLEAMLRSEDVREIAWAAYVIGHEHRTSLSGAVMRALDRAKKMTASGVDTRGLVRVLLASLADVGARGSMDLVGRYLAGSFTTAGSATVILLRASDAEVLRAWDQYEDNRIMCAGQLALGSRLAEHRVPGFCCRLLSALELTLHVVVLDQGQCEPPLARRSTDNVPGDCYVRREEGFPPIVFYDVARKTRIGATVLVEAPIPVFARRITGEDMAASGCIDLADADVARRALLATLLQSDRDRFPLPLDKAIYVHWTSEREFRDAVHLALRQYERLYWSVVDRAIEAGVLRDEEAPRLSPRISARLTDRRPGECSALELPAFEPRKPDR